MPTLNEIVEKLKELKERIEDLEQNKERLFNRLSKLDSKPRGTSLCPRKFPPKERR